MLLRRVATFIPFVLTSPRMRTSCQNSPLQHSIKKQCRSVPSTYIHALQLFVEAKRDQTLQEGSSSAREFSVLYEYQHKYVTALVKQLPPGIPLPTQSQTVSIHPPITIKHKPLRQGPFLLQPSPLTIEGSEGGDATDIIYAVLGNGEDEECDGETEKLGIVMIAYQDGKVDVCLDVDKVEARWEKKTVSCAPDTCLSVSELSLHCRILRMISRCLPCTRRWIWGPCPR